MPGRSTIAALAAELLGTFLLVAIAGGTGIVDAATGGAVGIAGVALAYGLAVAVLSTAFEPVGGGQLNPVVTVALWLVGKVRTRVGLRLIAAQLLGAVAAGFALKAAFGGFDSGDTAYSIGAGGVPMIADEISIVIALCVEGLLSALLTFAVLLTVVDKRAPKLGGLFAGFAVTAGVLAGEALTRASMNPARWFGPALAYGDLSNALVYVVGPLAGTTAAALFVRYLFSER